MAERRAQNAERQKRLCLSVVGYWLLINLFGCTTIKEVTKGIVGVSTKAAEDSRKDALKKTFNYDYNTCYKRVKEILIEKEAYIYMQDLRKHMLAVYVTKEDTTPVGIFFKEIDTQNTQIEVSSPSTFAKEFIGERLFLALEGIDAKR